MSQDSSVIDSKVPPSPRLRRAGYEMTELGFYSPTPKGAIYEGLLEKTASSSDKVASQ